MIDRVIYANGDSFTAGSELAADMLPGFPGNTSKPPTPVQNIKNSKWLSVVYHKYSHLIPSYLAESRQRAYPQKIGDALNCKVVNNAQGGASMDCIARNTISDLLNLKNDHKDIVAIIGTTQIYRLEIPIENNQWESVQVGHGFPNRLPDSFEKYYVKNYSVYHAFTNYYKNLIQIQNFCKVNDIRLIFVNFMYDSIPEDDIEETKKIIQLKNYLKEYDFNMSKIAHGMVGDIFAPCGHFTEIVHTNLAKEIVKTL